MVTAGPRLLDGAAARRTESGARLHERAVAKDAGPSFALSASQARHAYRRRTGDARGHFQRRRQRRRRATRCCGRSSSRSARTSITSASRGQAGIERCTGRLQRRPRPDRINNGADDDGSGVVALVEMAAAAMRGPRPKRSLLFVWHTGEESGGWGARYVTRFPPVPLDHIVAQLNLDMIGRSRRAGDQTAANHALTGPDEVYVVGASRLSRAPGRHRGQREPRVPEPHAEPEVRRPGRSRAHLRAKRPLPVRAEAASPWPSSSADCTRTTTGRPTRSTGSTS